MSPVTQAEMALPRIRVSDLVKRYGSVCGVDGVSFDVADGELISLLGPSGCGKTTTLRCIGGYETPTEGRIEIAGELVNDVPIYRRDIGMVFQSYALFPHKTVGENVGFALKMRGVSKAEQRDRIAEALALVGMPDYEARSPKQLSGGQRQRVALARAVIHRPAVLLLDEPLANLDRKLREQMRVEIKLIQAKVGISAVFVTHDQEEALVMSDRIAVMEGGRIHQLGTPSEIYNQPATPFVARFIGDNNFLEGQVVGFEGSLSHVRLCDGTIVTAAGKKGACGKSVGIVIRPERIAIDTESPRGAVNVIGGRVEFVTYLGSMASYRVKSVGGMTFQVMKPVAGERPRFTEGDVVSLSWTPEQGAFLD